MKLINSLRIVFASLAAASFGSFAAGPGALDGVDYSVARELKRDTSRPMREILEELGTPAPSDPTDYVVPNIFLDLDDSVPDLPTDGPMPPAQLTPSGDPMPLVGLDVDGMSIGNGGGGVPPDTTGDVGPDHFFQWVNTSWSLFDKNTGAQVNGPNPGNSFFAGFGGLCETTDNGDPLVLWDDQAGRWVVSQFAFTSTAAPPWLQCVAVSTSADPLGSYHRYAFDYSAFGFNDYGKMGVWSVEGGDQNAYLLTMHEFAGSFVGASFAVVERDRMLNGESAQFIRVGGLDAFGALPFHVEGDFPLAAGTCPKFVHFAFTSPAYRIWDMCVDWDAGTVDFGDPVVIDSEPFQLGLSGIPQLDSTTRLDDFGSNTMYIAAIRSFGPTGPGEAFGVINHAVDVGGDRSGARWVHFGIPMGSGNPGLDFESGFENFVPQPSNEQQIRIIDQGTYAPGSEYRWMGGINIDQSGNIAFGFNVSSETMNPQNRIAGRLRTDSPGMLRDETQCGPTMTGAQTGLFSGRARWGDYATMAIDPDDECTFYFTNEYYATTSFSSWTTRICSIEFETCGDPDFILETIPNSRIPVCGNDAVASVRAGEFGAVGENISLSQGTVPGGTSLNITTASIAAGESSQVTVTGSSGLADGNYSATVNGAAAGLNRSTDILIGVSSTTPGQPTLVLPSDAQTGIVTRPSFDWSDASGAVEYEIEIASDMAFTQVVDSAVVADSDYTSGVLLDEQTVYYWRVTALNYCGSGASSAVFSFTTGVAGECPSGTTPSSIFFDDVSNDSVAWVVDNAVGGAGTLWNKEVPPGGTGLNTRAWWADNSPVDSDQRLVTPSIALPTNERPLTVSWDTFHQYETNGPTNCWDGGNVEISVNGGDWLPLGNDRNLADPYLGQLSGNGPAGTAEAWCRQPAGGNPVKTVFLLDEFEGQNVEIRFRSSSDSNTVGPAPAGWGVDNVEVQSCVD